MLAALCLCLLVTAARAQVPHSSMATTFRLIPTVTETTTASARLPRPSRRIPTAVVDTQTRVVSQPVVDYVTSTVISSQVVPSVIVRTSVFRSTVVVPQEVVPGAVRQVVRTSEQVVRSTVIRQLTTTLETTQLRTSVQFRTQTKTIFVTSTQIVPQTEEVLKTRVVSQPSAPVVSTFVQEEVRFRTVPVQVPGAVRTSTVIQQSQRVIPVESEVVVPQVKTIDVTSTELFERTLYKTYTSQQVVPVQVVNTQYVDSRIVKTQQIQVTNTDIRVNTNFVTVTEPAREVVSVVYRTDVNVVTQPGNVIPVVRTQTVEQIVNREVLSTRVIPNIVVRTKFIDCHAGVNTEFKTQTQYVTRQDVRTSVSVVNKQVQVPTVVQVPRLQVSTQVVPVPGTCQDQLRTVYNTREITSFFQVPAETIVKTSIQYRTEVVSQPVRQPDTFVTVTSVNVVPVTSIVYRSRVVPQYVTSTKNVANTVTRTEATTQLVPVRSTIVQNVVSPRFVTDYVTDTQRVVRTEVKQVYSTVRVPSQPRVVYRTEVVQVASTVRGADTYNTQIVTVPVQREVYNTRIVDQVQNQERVVTQKRGGGYCGGGHSGGYGGYRPPY
ncbi:hypothetical protein FJT64_006023 [Amphibalanus amphitrite]|uniref:Zonadhesin n=1 Tax=Amphibalanus amphitrite TaxID=1232801 RepID=A0A6A4VY83_AMPAM|nr:hypothetical protein FJT64_006023 [Amphibalanus amphitrite]